MVELDLHVHVLTFAGICMCAHIQVLLSQAIVFLSVSLSHYPPPSPTPFIH